MEVQVLTFFGEKKSPFPAFPMLGPGAAAKGVSALHQLPEKTFQAILQAVQT